MALVAMLCDMIALWVVAFMVVSIPISTGQTALSALDIKSKDRELQLGLRPTL